VDECKPLARGKGHALTPGGQGLLIPAAGEATAAAAPAPHWLMLSSLPPHLQASVMKVVDAGTGWRLVSAVDDGGGVGTAGAAAAAAAAADGGVGTAGGTTAPPNVIALALAILVAARGASQAAAIVAAAPFSAGLAVLQASSPADATAMISAMEAGAYTRSVLSST
jgi:hypothetical protein